MLLENLLVFRGNIAPPLSSGNLWLDVSSGVPVLKLFMPSSGWTRVGADVSVESRVDALEGAMPGKTDRTVIYEDSPGITATGLVLNSGYKLDLRTRYDNPLSTASIYCGVGDPGDTPMIQFYTYKDNQSGVLRVIPSGVFIQEGPGNYVRVVTGTGLATKVDKEVDIAGQTRTLVASTGGSLSLEGRALQGIFNRAGVEVIIPADGAMATSKLYSEHEEEGYRALEVRASGVYVLTYTGENEVVTGDRLEGYVPVRTDGSGSNRDMIQVSGSTINISSRDYSSNKAGYLRLSPGEALLRSNGTGNATSSDLLLLPPVNVPACMSLSSYNTNASVNLYFKQLDDNHFDAFLYKGPGFSLTGGSRLVVEPDLAALVPYVFSYENWHRVIYDNSSGLAGHIVVLENSSRGERVSLSMNGGDAGSDPSLELLVGYGTNPFDGVILTVGRKNGEKGVFVSVDGNMTREKVVTEKEYSRDRPDLWPAGQEVDLGNGLSGIALSGVINDWSSSGILNVNTGVSIPGWDPSSSRLIEGGGSYQKGIDSSWHVIGYSRWNSTTCCNLNHVINPSGIIYYNFAEEGCNYNASYANYFFWFVYRK